MRPEYIDTLNSVRWGPSLWLVFVVPAVIIWYATFKKSHWLRFYVISVTVCWLLCVVQAYRVQSTKERHAVTAAEMQDMTADTWFLFAPFSALLGSIVYITLQATLAYSTLAVAGHLKNHSS